MDEQLPGKIRPLTQAERREAVGRPLGEPRFEFAPGIKQANEFAIANIIEGPVFDGFRFAEIPSQGSDNTVPALYDTYGNPLTKPVTETIIIDRHKDRALRNLIVKARKTIDMLRHANPSVNQEEIVFEICKLVATTMDYQRSPYVTHPGQKDFVKAIGQRAVFLGEATINNNLEKENRHKVLATYVLLTDAGEFSRARLRRGILRHPQPEKSGIHLWIELQLGHGPQARLFPIDLNITPGNIDYIHGNFQTFQQYGGFPAAVFDRSFHTDKMQFLTPEGQHLYDVGFQRYGRSTMVRPEK